MLQKDDHDYERSRYRKVQHSKKMSRGSKIVVKELIYFPDFSVRLMAFTCYTVTLQHFVLEMLQCLLQLGLL